jgi:hypothetical protein
MCQKLLSLPKKKLETRKFANKSCMKDLAVLQNLQNKSIHANENRCTTFSAFALAFKLVCNKLSGSAKNVCFNHYSQCSWEYKWQLAIFEQKLIHFKRKLIDYYKY